MAETVHYCPRKSASLMPCCGKTPFEVPRGHRISSDPTAVTCWPDGSVVALWAEFDAAVRTGALMLARAFSEPILKWWVARKETRR